MLVAGQLLNARLLQALGISLVAIAVISVVIFEFVIKGGVRTSVERGHITTVKGQEYQTILTIQSRGAGWLDTGLTSFDIKAGQQMQIEPLEGGKLRLRFLGKYAGRMAGIKVGITLTDPLNLLTRFKEFVHDEFVLDTLPQSLSTLEAPQRQRVYGFGEQPAGFPGAGQELYGLEKYTTGTDTKSIIWKRVAKSPDETLIASIREASVKEVVRVGVVQFAERGDAHAAWVDQLCEALGKVGKEVFSAGPAVSLNFNSPGRKTDSEQKEGEEGEEEALPEALAGLTFLRATDVPELAEAVMTCSAATVSREIEEVVSNSDFVVTGLRELEDPQLAIAISQKPLLLIPEEAMPSQMFTEKAIVWNEAQNLFPLIRKIVET